MKSFFNFILSFLFIFLIASCGSDDNSGGTTDDTPVPAFVGEVDWVKTFGGSSEDDAISIVQANDGDYVILGVTNSTDGDLSNRTGTDYDYWVLKICYWRENLE